MMYYIFKSPRKKGDKPIEDLRFEPTEFIIQHKAVKHGPIIILNEDEYRKIAKEEEADGRNQ